MLQFFGVVVKGFDGGDVRLLARSGMATSAFRLMNFVQTALDHLGLWMVPELVPQTHRDTPVRHGAVRIVGPNLLELFFRLFVPEGVQQGDAALEGLLH